VDVKAHVVLGKCGATLKEGEVIATISKFTGEVK
jgi:hypothetical protein